MTDDAPSSPDSGREPDAEPRSSTDEDPGTSPVLEAAEQVETPTDPEAATDADDAESDADAPETDAAVPESEADAPEPGVPDVSGDDADDDAPPEDVQKYRRFTKMDGAQYDRVNEFLRDRTYITAREWAIARLCADFRTETGVEMTKIGNNLPDLVPFMTDTYTPQAVNQARSSFKGKIRQSGATFLYGAMCNFFTAEELDEMMYEVTEVAKFLLEVEGVDLTVEEELEAEERISSVMREVRHSSEELRHDHAECPHCGGDLAGD